MKILIFAEGTILMHKNAVGHDRPSIVRQVVDKDDSVGRYAEYVPVGNAVEKIRQWHKQGAEIVYLTSRQRDEEIRDIRAVLQRHKFPAGVLEYRSNAEEYGAVAERVGPDLLIEDDCESIGGEKEMTYPHLAPEAKTRVRSVVVEEFGGIDDLPDDVSSFPIR